METCPFCRTSTTALAENVSCRAFLDRYPICEGHTLITPRRHVASFFDLTTEEYRDMLDLLEQVKIRLIADYNPTGFNIGLNDGADAGQTIMHVHLHVIPRYEGDVPDPRGGIRWIFPEKARYWEDNS